MVYHRGMVMVYHRGMVMVYHRGMVMVYHRGRVMVYHYGKVVAPPPCSSSHLSMFLFSVIAVNINIKDTSAQEIY